MQHTRGRVGDAHTLHEMPKASFSDETPLLVTMMEEVSQHSLLGGQTHVQGDAVVKLRKTFLLFFYFLSPCLGFCAYPSKKNKCVLLVCICINSSTHSFYCYLFHF